MCLNQILKDEQIVLMRYSAKSDQSGINLEMARLDHIARELELHPYTHRPYLTHSLKMARAATRPKSSSPAALAWENEGGAI